MWFIYIIFLFFLRKYSQIKKKIRKALSTPLTTENPTFTIITDASGNKKRVFNEYTPPSKLDCTSCYQKVPDGCVDKDGVTRKICIGTEYECVSNSLPFRYCTNRKCTPSTYKEQCMPRKIITQEPGMKFSDLPAANEFSNVS